MSTFFSQFTYNLTHPQAGMYRISVALFYPALLLLAGALAWAVFELGSLTAELWSRRGIRSLAGIEHAAQEARQDFVARRPSEAIAKLRGLPDTMFIRQYIDGLGDGTNLNPAKLVKMLSDTELLVMKRLERSRVFIRVAPTLGLMTTLIPISPALVALARGDVQTLSNNLVVAFSTTVVSLFIGATAYMISVVRDRLYKQDISDIEYVLDVLLEA